MENYGKTEKGRPGHRTILHDPSCNSITRSWHGDEADNGILGHYTSSLRNPNNGSRHSSEADIGLSSTQWLSFHNLGTRFQQTGKTKQTLLRLATPTVQELQTHTCERWWARQPRGMQASHCGTKRGQQEIYREIGKPAYNKSHSAPASQSRQETKTRDPPAPQRTSAASVSQTTTNQWTIVSTGWDTPTRCSSYTETPQVPETTSDWSADSVSETEFAPQGLKRHPWNPYYVGSNKDNDDPDLSLLAFTPNQISTLKSTMMDILREFKDPCIRERVLTRLYDLSEKLPRKRRSVAKPNSTKSRSVAKPSSTTITSKFPGRSRNKSLDSKTVASLMTGPPDTPVSSSVIKRIQNKTLMNLLHKCPYLRKPYALSLEPERHGIEA